jgi:hypothetical protein
MSLDPVSRLSQVMQLIGQQMSDRVLRLESGVAPPALAPTQPERHNDIQALKVKVRERLKAIALDDPRRPQKMQRAFLESVLAWQFGAELMLDQGFEDMVTGVQEGLSARPELQAQCLAVLDTL